MTKRLLLTLSLGLFATIGFAQTGKYWSANPAAASSIPTDKAVKRPTFPKEFKLFNLNIEPLRNELYKVVDNRVSHTNVISLPNADGQLEDFEIVEASNFEPALQARFPQIRAFSGKGITDRSATLKISYSPQGIQTMVFRADRGSEFIEPFSADHQVYAVFKSTRSRNQLPWACSTQEQRIFTENANAIQLSGRPTSSAGQLKTMRLAQSVTAEYSNWFGATSAAQVDLVLGGVNATMTRCNGVYELDLAVHLNLIANTTSVFYYVPATDPYSPAATGAGGAWNGELQATLTSVIGEANYDIGHLFGASGGGGNAGCIGCVCTNGSKGSGFTSPADNIPQGDNFDIDYVVHEVGHQLGANHTFSMSTEGTGVNKEVGSGITIMGYAGITNQDVAPHSIAIFHQASIQQIQTNLATKTCPVTVDITGVNATPVTAPLTAYTIPKSTPFILKGSATDANAGDVLTYCFEQNDNGTGQTGNNSVARENKPTGPNWLSFMPTLGNTRMMPKLTTVLAGLNVSPTLPGGDAIANTEALSSVARTLNFRLTVRDNAVYSSTAPISVGQTSFQDVAITVDAATGPFVVTAPNTTGISWQATTQQTITWSVNGTTGAPINCQFVNIKLSTDGGTTFPITLATNTANDGTETITVPNNPTSTARVLVEAVGNIFFDINNANFTITVPPTGFNFVAPAAASISCGSQNSAAITLNTSASGGFSTPINLTAAGNPAGTTVSFGTNPLTPGNNTTVTLNNTNTLAPGTYSVTVTGTAGAVVQSQDLTYTVQPGVPPSLTLQPTDVTVCSGAAANFTSLAASASAITYQWQVSTDGGTNWTNISGATNNIYSIPAVTNTQNGYKYRVIASTLCGSSTSTVANLTVNSAPSITNQPADAVICTGSNITFSVTAAGNGLTYQWQISTDGGATWNNISGANANAYTLNSVTAAQNGNQFHVIVSGGCAPSPVTSSPAILTVSTAVSVLTQPAAQVVCSGSNVTFTAEGSGSGVNYQWQVSTDGGTTWSPISGATSSTYTITGAAVSQNGYLYQAILTNASCTQPTLTNSAALTVNSLPAVTTQPTSVTLCAGSNQTFTGAGTGTGLAYQWQVSTNGGTTFTDIAGETSATLNLSAITTAQSGNIYHLVVSGTCAPNAISNNATLTVIAPESIQTQPSNRAVCVGGNVTFTGAASGSAPIYQWQISTDGGATWTDIAGATNASYSITGATTALNGNQYRLKASNSTCTTAAVSNGAVLTVNALPNVVASAAAAHVCTGNPVELTATGATTYTWTPGNLNGATVTVNPAVNPNTPGQANTITYTVTGTDGNGCVNTNTVDVTADPLPNVTLTSEPASPNVYPGITVLLKASVTPAANYTFVWTKNGTPINNNTDSLRVGVGDMGEYAVSAYVNITCQNTSNSIAVRDSASNQLFIYPNPNNGQFTVAYHNPGGVRFDNPNGLTKKRTINVYDAMGRRVNANLVNVTFTYDLISVDMRNVARGTYFVELLDAAGFRMATGKVLIQ